MRSLVKDLLVIMVIVILIVTLLRLFVSNYVVTNENMVPGLRNGEHILINKLSYSFDEPERGEIVLLRSQNDNIDQIRRIIGLPGDILEIHDKSVFINGIRLSEPYVKIYPDYTLPAYQLPTNYFFVLSDNRNTPGDYEDDWTVSRQNITGRAWIFTWPPEKWGIVANYPLSQQLTAAQSP